MYDSEVTEMNGTSVDALYALGFGIERRLRDFSVGAQFHYIQAIDTGARDMAVGIQAGYGWSL